MDWILFRIKYLYWQKSGYFDKVNKKIVKKAKELKQEQLYMPKFNLVNRSFQGDSSFIEKANKAIKGNIYAFSHEYLNYYENDNIAWNMNPVSKVKANSNISWNNLPDFGEYGDIKLIWEASRFPQIYYFINAYSVTQDEKYAKACLKQITDWIDANPYPLGVNYKCGQEITFRVIAWIIAIDYFRDFLSSKDEKKIVANIYIALLRVDANIDYAAKAVKNNHSLSEAVGLIIFGLYFKQFEESKKLLKRGIDYLQKECAYQIYPDGSYIQHSFTYQRLALDVLSFVIMLCKKNNYDLSESITKKHKSMIVFLYSFIQDNGWLPNYGTNDGANLFPISRKDYRDFRESLDFASLISWGKTLFFKKNSIGLLFDIQSNEKNLINKQIRFDDGGYYILKDRDIFSFIRCHSYHDRPAQNDMLHLDVWYKGVNIFCDTGSYSYNTDKEFKNNFNGTTGHNTIMINDENQMEQVLNFGWSNWTQSKLLTFDDNHFVGEHYGYKKKFGVTCRREILKENNKLTIIDSILNITKDTNIKQIWNTKEEVEKIDDFSVKAGSCILTSNQPINLEEAYISDYYNSYEKGTKIIIEIVSGKDIDIKTTMEFVS